MSTSSKEVGSDVFLYTDSEDEEEEEIVYSTQTEAHIMAVTRLGKPYHKNYDDLTTGPYQPPPS